MTNSLPQKGEAPKIKLSAIGLAKSYNRIVALHPSRLDVEEGELLTLLGPSGSGKTTLLQLISGLVDPTEGRLLINDRDCTRTAVHQRDIGVVFQSYALFPHLTVAENIAFPLEMRGLPGGEVRSRVDAALDMVGLSHAKSRSPKALSGGQQQRVALARCLVYKPSIILMDEPLGALDRKLREIMQVEIKRIHRETGATIIFVTHDQEEALALSDRVCLMNEGRIEQIGSPQDLYEYPNTTFVADFIGVSNIFRGTMIDGQFTANGLTLPIASSAPCNATAIVVRPENMQVNGEASWAFPGIVLDNTYVGSETRVSVELANGTEVIVRQPAKAERLPRGAAITVSWDPEAARYLSS